MPDHGGARPSNVIGVGNLPKGQPYGTGAQQARALQAAPLSGGGPSGGPTPTSEPAAGLQPGQIPGLEDPTARPDEPLTAGLDVGMGPGSEALGNMAPQGNEEVSVLRLLYQQYGNEDIRRLLDYAERSV